MKRGSAISIIVIVIAVIIAVQVIIGAILLLVFQPWKAKEPIVPDTGVFYCEELLTVIDFTAMDERGYTDCAIRYTDDSMEYYENVYPKITQGTDFIGIESNLLGSFNDYPHYYVTGVCAYSDDTFTITSENPEKVYSFKRIDEESINALKEKAVSIEEASKEEK